MSDPVAPQPIPPWHRPIDSPVVQELTEAGAINLACDTTYLISTASGDPISATLPDGNFKRQTKRIYIPGDIQNTTASWRISGTFVGFATLLFDTIGWSAVLEFDGDGWHLVGGNAKAEP